MATDDKLSGALQENILTLLCFDSEFCKLVRSIVSPNLFESAVYRDIASHAIDFVDQFGEPIAEHLPDSLEAVLKGDDKRKAQSYQRLMDNLFLAKDSVNQKYTISKIHDFVRQQNLKGAVVRAVEAIEGGDLDLAEVELNKGLRSQVNVFELGTNLAEAKNALSFMDDLDAGIRTGIVELDKRDIMPRAGEMLLLVAPMKKGKSWGLIHFGKWAILQRKTVAHVTLEMSEKRVSQRYIQSFFSITKREAKIKTPIFKVDELGRLTDIEYEELSRPSLSDPNIRKSLTTKIRKEFNKRSPLIIKQFPTSSLTINELDAWLDGLERFHKIVPDMLIVDYPDLMKLDSANLRIDTGSLYKQLRGIANKRNLAVVTASQGNRESMKAKMVTDSMIAEDVSKIATADIVITYSQTEQEKALGLARLFVSNARNDEDKFVVLISQAYAAGQFCLSSVIMLSDYWDILADTKDET
jgi:replicative DNA helicase